MSAKKNVFTLSKILDKIKNLGKYPVGYIYLSTDPTSPAELFGGTWETIEDCFLLMAGATYKAGNTGGEAEHTLTIDEMPNHNHGMPGYSSTRGSQGLGCGSPIYGLNTSARGGSKPHNNMPPYLTVYGWRKTAD